MSNSKIRVLFTSITVLFAVSFATACGEATDTSTDNTAENEASSPNTEPDDNQTNEEPRSNSPPESEEHTSNQPTNNSNDSSKPSNTSGQKGNTQGHAGADASRGGGEFTGPGNGETDSGDYQDGENYEKWQENEFTETTNEDTSTFSVDVDNASYTVTRRDLQNGRLPKPESVRTEEFINYFDYDYRKPVSGRPFSINMEVGPSKFGDNKHMLQIGLKGKEIPIDQMKPTNLVFLIDVSGSMQSSNKLKWVKQSMYTLLDHLRPNDTVGIVVYAGADGVVLEPTKVKHKSEIVGALENLRAGGSTNAEAGIVSAYEMAEQAKKEGGNNRVILATDGDFNVGKTDEELVELIKNKRDQHISLTAVGYGMGNYQGSQMSGLAQKGNGNYFYIDSLKEAKRIFGEQLPSTLEVIASDVKVQVVFDQEVVKEYRLVGYETRHLENDEFDDDSKDAGEIGPGHTVTALYETKLHPPSNNTGKKNLLAKVKLRYKDQYGESSNLLKRSLKRSQIRTSFGQASTDFRFVTAVTEFAEILRESQYSEGAKFDQIETIARNANPNSSDARTEFINLVDKAKQLWEQN